ncbi:MAG: Asp-tRNA(Asn)/Glu-tRNA(Gln) amidotransferase subunit GatA [Pseudomonadota bacterium]|nr:Asp-tRNA(Asn)/Glu-tRNA(Gln) amidotransferase subunit GatA [Pseudomonadota bacterium]
MDTSFPEDVAGIVEGLENKRFSSREITTEYLTRIKHLDPLINSFITVCEESALAESKIADEIRANGDAHSLTGVPYANKDLFCTKSIRTTCGSRMLHNFIPPYDAEIVTRARKNSLVMLGKTNMDEFAMGSSNETSYFGKVKNPWHLDRVPGGSSGGSAAAVAAKLTPVASGSDTGGSIRQPASFCGVSGIKPTYGRVSRYGMIAFASSLDQGGPIGRTAKDLALFLNLIGGFDEKDSTSSEVKMEDFCRSLELPLEGIKFGLPKEFFNSELDDKTAVAINTAVHEIEKLGGNIMDISLPNTDLAIPAYYIIAPAECSSNLARYDGIRFGHRTENATNINELYERTRSEGFGQEVKRRILLGTYALSSGYYDQYYEKAQRVRRLIKNDYLAAFDIVDFVVGPTTPTTAFPFSNDDSDPTIMYLRDIYTTPANLAGLPALSIPAGNLEGMPIGLQMIGNYFDEARMLGAAHRFQQMTDWHTLEPRL